MHDMQWNPLDTVGETGSEGGVILRDLECAGCRITLEQCAGFCAITCGIGGAFCHTAFCGIAECDTRFAQMLHDLEAFLDSDTAPEQELQFYEQFAARY